MQQGMRPSEEVLEVSLVQRTTVYRHQHRYLTREKLKLVHTEFTDVFVIKPLAVPRARGHPIARIWRELHLSWRHNDRRVRS